MSAFLALEDGTVFRGDVRRRRRRRVRRGRLHDGDDRLPGDRHRSELRGAARLLHRSDGRQLRRRGRPRRVAGRPREGGADARGARPGMDGVAGAERDRRADGDRHALARAPPARGRRHARRRGRGRRRRGGGARSGSGETDDGGRGPRRAGLDARALRLLRRRLAPRRGARLRLQALDPAPPRRRRGARHGLPARRRRGDAARPRRRPALERPRRPGAARRRGRRSSGICSAASRCSESASATSCSGSRPATGRTSFPSATAAPTIRCWSGAVAACSSRARTTVSRSRPPTTRRRRTSRSTTAPSRASTSRELQARSVQFHPEAGPGPHDAWPILERWVEEVRSAA